MAHISRRGLLGLAGASALGASAGVTGTLGVGHALSPSQFSSDTSAGTAQSYPFYGVQQAGITTPAQDHLHFASFDVSDITRAELQQLLHNWTTAASRLTQGLGAGPLGPTSGPYNAPPDDTGDALDLPPSGLTITFGFGSTLFRNTAGVDRFGLAHKHPVPLVTLPHFPGDALIDSLTGGDLCIQACSNDPQVAVHAIRNLSRIAFGRASIRWSQLGYGRTSSTTTQQPTPRNLFGFKDGTANIKAEESANLTNYVWVHPSDNPAWMTNGTYLVTRRIRMTIETWDHASLKEQERVIGRTKKEGAPLSGGSEFETPQFDMKGRENKPLIDPKSHVSAAHPTNNNGVMLLRRGYNFVDGNDELGRLNAGLFFMAFQRDPRTAFIPIQTNLAQNDDMNEYIRHVGSGIFAIPPGTRNGGYIGETLFND